MERIKKSILLKKTITVITALCFMSGIFYTPPVYAAANSGIAAVESFGIPVSSGKITKAKYFASKDIVINIQDLHCHGEVQRNIAAMLGDIDKKYGLKEVYLEGAAGTVETRQLSRMKGSELGSNVIEQMLDSGYLNGTEYYSAVNEKEGFINGIEEKEIYEKNIGILNRIVREENEIKKLVNEMRKEMGPVRKEYGNKEIYQLDKLTEKYKKEKISASKYYTKLMKMAVENGINIEEYKNLTAFERFMAKTGTINFEKAGKEFVEYIGAVREKITYAQYMELSEKSGGFANIEEIGKELKDIDARYGITAEKKLYNLAGLLGYMEFVREINPLDMAMEESALKEEIYVSLGRTVYEREVIYLSEYIDTIEGYFTANITAGDLAGFDEGFKKFKKVWCSYFSKPAAEKLEAYGKLLGEYHRNNVKRDIIFADKLKLEHNKNAATVKEGKEALRYIGGELTGANIKVVVTGGFHSKGLEKIFEENGISYVVVMPKVTKQTEDAYDVYRNTVMGYREIAQSTINIKPFMSEGVEVSVPKLMASCYMVLEGERGRKFSIEEKKAGIYEFVNGFLANRQSEAEAENRTEEVKVEGLEIGKYDKNGMEFKITYAGQVEGAREYGVKSGKLTFKNDGSEIEIKAESGRIAPLSAFDDKIRQIFNGTNNLGYKLVTGFVVPILEELAVRVLPFAGVGLLIGNPVSFIPIALTCIAGIGVFTFVHKLADEKAVAAGRLDEIRDVRRIFISSVVLTGVYMGIYIAFPGISFLAAPIAALAHIGNNLLSMAGIIRNPILDIINARQKKQGTLDRDELKNLIAKMEEVLEQKDDTSGAPVLKGEKREEYETLLDNFKKAGASEMQGLFAALYEFITEDDAAVFANVIESAVSAGRHFNYPDTDTTFSEKFFGEFLKNFWNFELEYLFSVAAGVYLKDNAAGYRLVWQMYEKQDSYMGKSVVEMFNEMNGVMTTVDYNNVKQMRDDLPDSWKAVLADDDDVESYYENIGIEIGRGKYFKHPYDNPSVQILRHLPEDVYGSVRERTEIEMKIEVKKPNPKILDKSISKKFDSYVSVLRNNSDALAELNGTHDTAIQDSLVFVERMIEGLKQISEKDGLAAEQSFRRIKAEVDGGLNRALVKKHKTRDAYWEQANLDSIDGVHTLINAVHQTASREFMKVRGAKGEENNTKQIVAGEEMNVEVAEYSGDDEEGRPAVTYRTERVLHEKVTVNDFSETSSAENDNVSEFLLKLAKISKTPNHFLAKDGLFVWSVDLGSHSVDVLINFGNLDEGIRLSFSESSTFIGNKLRIYLLQSEIAAAGFEIIKRQNEGDNNYSFQAGFFPDKSDRLNIGEKYAEMFMKIDAIFGNTIGVDVSLTEQADTAAKIRGPVKEPNISSNDYRTARDNPWILSDKLAAAGLGLDERYKNFIFNTLRDINSDALAEGADALYEYLGIEKGKRNVAEIVRRFGEGKLIVNPETGILEVNGSYVPMEKIMRAIRYDRDEAFRQAQIINLINYGDLNFTADGNIGEMMSFSGVLKVKGGLLSVKGVVDRKRRRMKCAYTEFVSYDGKRKVLKYEGLISLLHDEGYPVKRQEPIRAIEKEKILSDLGKRIKVNRNGVEVIGYGISKGPGQYVTGVVTYEAENVGANSIWVVDHTTPDDVAVIENTRGIINTSGGMFSHANITAREKEKVAVLLSERWSQGALEITYYVPEGKKMQQDGFETQFLAEKTMLLQEGQKIFINGETGKIMVFGNVAPGIFENILYYVEHNDVERVKAILTENAGSEYAGEIAELVYFQVYGKDEYADMLEMLFGFEDENIASKMRELNLEYVAEMLEKVNNMMGNIKKTDNVNIAFNMMCRIERIMRHIDMAGNSYRNIDAESIVMARVRDLNRDLVQKLNDYVADFKRKADALSSKQKLSEKDLDKAVKMSETAKVWRTLRGFSGFDETVARLNDTINRTVRANQNSDTSMKIKRFAEIGAADAWQYGSKTTELANIARFMENNIYADVGVFVPEGVGIGKDVFESLLSDEDKALLDSFEKAVLSGKSDEALAIALKIIEMIKSKDISELSEQMEYMLDADKNYAVRSSGVGEDGALFAFAGMGKTSLNVVAREAAESIRECWQSFFEERSVEYMAKNRQIVRPAVLVQEMVKDVEKAGVIFTRDSNDNLVIETVLGLGEGLVSGRITPDHIAFKIEDNSIEYIRAVSNTKKIVAAEKGIKVVDLTPAEKVERIFNAEMIEKLVYIASDLEKAVGYPVDIEFAVDSKGRIFILQRRAITTFENDINIEVVRKLQEKHDIAVSSEQNVNVGEEFINIGFEQQNGVTRPVTVYYNNTEKTLYLSADDGYLLSDEKFIAALSDRINNDPAVLKKINRMSFAQILPGDLNIIPIFMSAAGIDGAIAEKQISIKNMSKMLAAA